MGIRFENEAALQSAIMDEECGKSRLYDLLEVAVGTNEIHGLTATKEASLGEAGKADILAVHWTNNSKPHFFDCHILELKNGPVTPKAFNQVLRYRDAVRITIEASRRTRLLYQKGRLRLWCHLVGTSNAWTSYNFFWCAQHIERKYSVLTHTFELDPRNGLTFEVAGTCSNIEPPTNLIKFGEDLVTAVKSDYCEFVSEQPQLEMFP